MTLSWEEEQLAAVRAELKRCHTARERCWQRVHLLESNIREAVVAYDNSEMSNFQAAMDKLRRRLEEI